VPRFKKDCSYTSTPPIRLTACTRTALPYPRVTDRTREFAAIATVLQYLMLCTLLLLKTTKKFLFTVRTTVLAFKTKLC